jgi:restriction system protein
VTRPLAEAILRAIRPLVRVLGWPLRLFREPRIRARTIGELLMLNPSQFEEAIAQSLRDNGYRHVRRRGGPGDLGVDITCHDPNGQRVAVQCKRYAPGKLVRSRDVQLFIGMVTTEHPVDRGVFITTSGFTEPARSLAKRHPWIRLIDGGELAHIIGPEGPPLLTAQSEPEPYGPVLTGHGSTTS